MGEVDIKVWCLSTNDYSKAKEVLNLTSKFNTEYSLYNGDYKIFCPIKLKKVVIKFLKKYALNHDLKNVFWIDDFAKYNRLDESYLALFSLKNKGDIFYTDRSRQPKDLRNYINSLEKYLGVQIIETYGYDAAGGFLILKVKDIDNKKYQIMLDKFTDEFGVGPFKDISLLKNYGSFLNNYCYESAKGKVKSMD